MFDCCPLTFSKRFLMSLCEYPQSFVAPPGNVHLTSAESQLDYMFYFYKLDVFNIFLPPLTSFPLPFFSPLCFLMFYFNFLISPPCLQAPISPAAPMRATTNQPSVTATPASAGVWTSTAMSSLALENRATPTAVKKNFTEHIASWTDCQVFRSRTEKVLYFTSLTPYLSNHLLVLVFQFMWAAEHLFSLLTGTDHRLWRFSLKPNVP